MSRAGLWIADPPQAYQSVAAALRSATPALLFGLRLWAAVCLALYIAFWLELDSPSWAGTTAAVVCQPRLGASLRKGWFRMIGTPTGGVAIVVLTACFPQDRTMFLVSLALWAAACSFACTLLQNYAAYAAALSGYTALIIASDQLGATGGLNGEAFTLAITRVTEIGIGIVSAGIVLAGTDLGDARRQLAALFANLATGIMAKFTGTLQAAGPDQPDTRPVRRDFIRRVIALNPSIDQTIGESSQIRYHLPVLQKAVDGLFATLSGWRAIANHLVRLPDDQAMAEAATVLQSLPTGLTSLPDPAAWTADAIALRRICEAGAHRLIALGVGTPSQRLLADKAAEVVAGMAHALNGLALLVGEPARPFSRRGAFRLQVTDWLPALVNAARTFVTILAVALFWIVTAWPSGAEAIIWAAIPTILFAPRADQAYASARGFVAGAIIAAVAAAVVAFAVLPNLETFAAFSFAIGLWLVPTGAVSHQWRKPVSVYMSSYFVPLLAPMNQMSYDTVAFYNTATAIVGGAGAAALSFSLIPPLSPAFRTRRLLALTLRDLHRLTRGPNAWTANEWQGRVYSRLSVLPEQAEPLQRAQLLAALSVGIEIIRLRRVAHRFDQDVELDAALNALAKGNSSVAIERLTQLNLRLAVVPDTEPGARARLRARGSILAMSEALDQHAAYFDSGAA
jgi:uncharacterized membrane protein YccC